MRAVGVLVAVAALALEAGVASAQEGDATPTRVTIRAVANEAKLIGDGVGGVYIRVVDAGTGEVLAEGRQRGGTGNTERIMSTPRRRGLSVFDTEGAAAFVAELSIREPTLVNISAIGPLGHPQATQTATKRMLIVPGGHIEGDGVILELHGFIVEVQLPEPLAPVAGSLDVQARVRLMCGCPLRPGGLWDSDLVRISARLLANGEIVAEKALAFSGQTSIFTGRLAVPGGLAGRDLELEVLAADPPRINAGHHRIPLGGPE